MKITAFLAVLSLFCNAASAATGAELFQFEPAVLELNDFNAGAEVKVALKVAPKEKTTIYFEGPNLSFDKCSLDFEPATYNTAQVIKVVPVPYQTAAQEPREVPMNFKLWSPGYDGHNQTVAYTVKRGPLAAGQCNVNGDPHYKTFDQTDAQTYHYQGEGTYYLVRSPELTIQAFQQKCHPNTTCVTKIAVRYGKTVFVLDGAREKGSCLTKVTEFDGVTVAQNVEGAVENYNFAFNGGSNMKVSIAELPEQKMQYMNVLLDLATHYRKKVDGLCGHYDGVPENDYTGSDGKVYPQSTCFEESKNDAYNTGAEFKNSNLFKFAESWRVPDNDNIFTCGDKCAGSNTYPVAGDIKECQIPALQEPKKAEPPVYIPRIPDGYQAVKSCPSYTPAPIAVEAPKNLTYEIPENVLNQAAEGCVNAIQEIPECKGLADVNTYRQLCQLDIRAKLNAQLCYNLYNSNYKNICAKAILSKCKEPKKEEREKYQEVAKQNGYGRNPCNCPSDATCTTSGCVCTTPGHTFRDGKCVAVQLPTEIYQVPAARPAPTDVDPAPKLPPPTDCYSRSAEPYTPSQAPPSQEDNQQPKEQYEGQPPAKQEPTSNYEPSSPPAKQELGNLNLREVPGSIPG
ncbi:hypothetical protein BKA69DRAFT_1138294 [Paraphysoderma sedebokerense]|nr:hypothetical protein BKA69DRAFT_1138294 [Paraphysoderma sedebokerense]